MSLYIMVLIGGQALGGPLMGWFAEHLGVQWAMLIAGGVPALAAATIALVLAKRGQLTLRVNLRSARRPLFIVPRPASGSVSVSGSVSGRATPEPS